MVEVVNNPFTDALIKAIKSDDSEAEYKTRLDWERWNMSHLQALDAKLEGLNVKLEALPVKVKTVSVSQQYKQAITLYKECRDLLVQIRLVKKLIREGMKKQREVKKNVSGTTDRSRRKTNSDRC